MIEMTNTTTDYYNVVSVLFLSTIGLFMNIFLMLVLILDEKLMKKKFPCYIFMQCLTDCVILVSNIPPMVFMEFYHETSSYFPFGLFSCVDEIMTSFSLLMLTYRMYIQARSVTFMCTKSTCTSHKLRSKWSTFTATIKVVAVLLFLANVIEILFPSCYFCQQFFKYHINYPPNIKGWNYFLIFGNILFFYGPFSYLVLCAFTTIKKMNQYQKNSAILLNENLFLSRCYKRTRQSTFVIFSLIACFVVTWFPFEIYSVVYVINGWIPEDHATYFICMILVMVSNVVNPLVIVSLSSEIRNACMSYWKL